MNRKWQVMYGDVEYVTFNKVTRNRLHRHDFFEPCIVISGQGEFEHDNTIYQLSPGDLFLAKPGVFHEIRSLSTKNLELYFFSFSITPLDTENSAADEEHIASSAINQFLMQDHVYLKNFAHLLPLFEYIYTSRTRLAFSDKPFLRNDGMTLLVNNIMVAFSPTDSQEPENAIRRNLEINVYKFIDDNMAEGFHVKDMAKSMALSESTLRRRWKSISGRPIRKEIIQRRMEKACLLLALQDIPIYDVGRQVGIEDAGQFSRNFKKIIGRSPKVYRDEILQKTSRHDYRSLPYRTEFKSGEIKQY